VRKRQKKAVKPTKKTKLKIFPPAIFRSWYLYLAQNHAYSQVSFYDVIIFSQVFAYTNDDIEQAVLHPCQ
jgi:hypothetical protein